MTNILGKNPVTRKRKAKRKIVSHKDFIGGLITDCENKATCDVSYPYEIVKFISIFPKLAIMRWSTFSSLRVRPETMQFVMLFMCLTFTVCTCACPEIVRRAEWGARAVKPNQKMGVPVGHVFIHHTAGATCTSKATCSKVARQTQNFHINTNKWNDLGYSFLVGGDGRIYEGRGWTAVGAHTYGYNSKAIGISFMGNFDKVTPNNAMLNAARKLIDCGVEKNYITKNRQIHGHRDAKCTACPGAVLYKIIKTWPGFKGGKLPGYAC